MIYVSNDKKYRLESSGTAEGDVVYILYKRTNLKPKWYQKEWTLVTFLDGEEVAEAKRLLQLVPVYMA